MSPTGELTPLGCKSLEKAGDSRQIFSVIMDKLVNCPILAGTEVSFRKEVLGEGLRRPTIGFKHLNSVKWDTSYYLPS